jgi:hypothetical protein
METTDKDLKFAIKAIKAAKKLGVSKLKLGTLEFELRDLENPRSRPTFKVSKKEVARQDRDGEEQLKFNAAMTELSTMHVEDPSGYERAIVEGDLVDDNSGDDIEETRHI